MAGKSIKAKAYKNNNFEKTREYLKLNYKYPEFSIGFWWVLRARCGYKLDARDAKAAKMIEEDFLTGFLPVKNWKISKKNLYLFQMIQLRQDAEVYILVIMSHVKQYLKIIPILILLL